MLPYVLSCSAYDSAVMGSKLVMCVVVCGISVFWKYHDVSFDIILYHRNFNIKMLTLFSKLDWKSKFKSLTHKLYMYPKNFKDLNFCGITNFAVLWINLVDCRITALNYAAQ